MYRAYMKNNRNRRTENLIPASPALFYFLSFTVGLPMSFLGAILAFFVLITGHKPTVYHNCICFRCRKKDGCSLGCFMFVGRFSSEELLMHELGHAIQNCLYGPLMPFLVGIPSSTRYHYRNFKQKVLHKKLTTRYDSVWFEAEATALGKDYVKRDLLRKDNTK